jgi:opacity protein-like surface antigen
MSLQTFRAICAAIIVAIGLMPIERSLAASPSQSIVLTAPRKIAQAPTQEQLDRQREAERVLKEGEQLRQDVKNNNYYNNRDAERQVGEQINKVRESGSDPQKVREADAELTRLRQQNQQNNRPNYYYDPFYPYYTTPAPIIFTPIYSTEPTSTSTERNASRRDNTPSNTQILGSIGLKDGAVSPGIGIRYNNIGFEIGGIFNQDSLPRSVNNFSLPSNFFFTDLGLKKLSPQWGGDLLGFVDVAPRVAIYGSVGVYFQSQARIAQSLATSELYKQTDETNVTGAVGGGVTYSPGEGVSVGLGYHSLRGVTARLGISF